MRGAAILLCLLTLTACTPPAPKQSEAAAPKPGLNVSGYATVGVVRTF